MLVTGFDIIFFWVARMMMMGLHFMKEVPFETVYIHALVRDEKGQKMSKSKGNVMDPLELIDRYGADALRFTLAAMAAQGRDIKLSPQRVEGYRNFATKLWNAARFAEMNECVRQPDFDPADVKETLNRWIAGETERAARAVTAAIEGYRFNEAAGAVYEFVWGVFCDWYLELIKPILTGEDEAAKAETRATAAWVLDQILKLLHPFMPFITEELWAHMVEHGVKRRALLALSEWPQYSGLESREADEEIGWVVRVVSEIRSVRTEMNVPAGPRSRWSSRERTRHCVRVRRRTRRRSSASPGSTPCPLRRRRRKGRAARRRRDDAGAAARGRDRHGRGAPAAGQGDRGGGGRRRQDGRQARQPAVRHTRQARSGRGDARAQVGPGGARAPAQGGAGAHRGLRRRRNSEAGAAFRSVYVRGARAMPARSKAQQKAAGAALSAKRGETPKSKLKGASKGMVKSMSETQLEELAATKRKGLPEHKRKK